MSGDGFGLTDVARGLLARIDSMIFAAEHEADAKFKAFLAQYLDRWKAQKAELEKLIAR